MAIAGILILLLLPSGLGVAGHTALPAGSGGSVPVVVAARSANGSGNSTYCPGGTPVSANVGNQTLASCSWLASTSPYYAVGFYANASSGAANYSFLYVFGDGTNYTVPSNGTSNVSGTFWHYYAGSGNYTYTAFLVDSLGRLTVSGSVTVRNFSSSALTLSLSYSESPSVTPTTSVVTTQVSGGVPVTNPYGLPLFAIQVSFGDGNLVGGPNRLSNPNQTFGHTYGPVANRTSYVVNATAWGQANTSGTPAASATITVSPSYNVNGSGVGNASAGTRVVILSSSANSTTIWLMAWNGSFLLNSTATLISGIRNVSLGVRGTVTTPSSSASVNVSYGDGNLTGIATAGGNGTVVSPFVAVHAYVTAGNRTLTVRAALASGSPGPIQVSTVLYVHFLNTSGGGTGNASVGTSVQYLISNSTTSIVRLLAWNGAFRANATFRSTAVAGADNASVVLLVSGAVAPVRVAFSWGDGNGTNATVNLTNLTLSGGHFYLLGGVVTGVQVRSYLIGLLAFDGNRTVLSVSANASVAFLPGVGGGGPPPASSVTVTVDASPVTGTAPLTTTLSAFLSGGSPPFAVTWSLPGSNYTGNASGLLVPATYPNSGWYPATAFAYNTTTPSGWVLVGVGSIWIFVGANGSGGSGNGSGGNGSNRSGLTPVHGGDSTLAALQTVESAGLLGAIVSGAVIGGAAGFAVGKRSSSRLARLVGRGRDGGATDEANSQR